LAQGRVRCWGDNQYGQLGYGDFAERRTPNGDVDLGGPAIGIAAGHSFTCALMADGRVRCWGDDSVGQLGYGSDRTIVGNDPEDMPPGDVPGL
jgi:alpha-tubulin suppressor-like RCC1 family protein